MKKAAAIAVTLVVLGVVLYCLRQHTKPDDTSGGVSVASAASGTVAPGSRASSSNSNLNETIAPSAVGSTIRPALPPQGALEITNVTPQEAMSALSSAIHQYSSMFHGNPIGVNAEITAQLRGANPKHANFMRDDAGMRVNQTGELIDAWGTPYFFHQLSGTDMEIHSAGPDRVMWTADDLVTH